MTDKIIAWFANLALACVLVFLALQSPVYAQSESLTVPLTGTAVTQTVGNLQIQPARFDTGMIDIGQSTTQTVQLKHVGASGSEAIQINASNIFGGHASEFSSNFSGYQSLFPGDTVDVSVTFTPSVPGTKSAALRMDIGNASAPHVLIISGKARYPLTSILESASPDLAMGQAFKDVPLKKNLTLTNVADEADAPLLNVLSVGLTGDTPQDFSTTFAPTGLGPGQSVTFEVQMLSAQVGHKEAFLEVQHDGSNKPVKITLSGDVVEPAAVPVNFANSVLNNTGALNTPTSLQFGPDNHLYVTEMNGDILEFAVTRNGPNNYAANKIATIKAIATTQNHNDDGSTIFTQQRLLTGILVTGSAAQPIIYAYSGDWRQGGGPAGTHTDLDTNSGILHKLTKNGQNWTKQDLVRGLPRSDENHQGNGLAFLGNKLLLAMGGNTNMGVPSNNFAGMSETALSAAILEFDLQAIGNGPYDLPTLDDEDQPGVNDNNDPFGGNDGKNQAKLVAGGPVQIYSPGYRNPYDLVVTQSGKLYVTDNGPNVGWGGKPGGACLNAEDNGGETYIDQLHYVPAKGYYGGHPNPIRGNKANTFNDSNPQTPIEIAANPEECNYKVPGQGDGSLATFPASTNGIDEYTATNFSGAMLGDLLLTGFDKAVYRIQLNGAGNAVTSKSKLIQNFGQAPLDITAQGDADVFPGTVWVVDSIADNITVFEPADY